jgi:hypothetical protein
VCLVLDQGPFTSKSVSDIATQIRAAAAYWTAAFLQKEPDASLVAPADQHYVDGAKAQFADPAVLYMAAEGTAIGPRMNEFAQLGGDLSSFSACWAASVRSLQDGQQLGWGVYQGSSRDDVVTRPGGPQPSCCVLRSFESNGFGQLKWKEEAKATGHVLCLRERGHRLRRNNENHPTPGRRATALIADNNPAAPTSRLPRSCTSIPSARGRVRAA